MTKQKQTEEKESNKGSFKDRYKKCLSEIKKIPTVPIKGKRYSIVAERFKHLKEYFLQLKLNLKTLSIKHTFILLHEQKIKSPKFLKSHRSKTML